MGQSPGIAAAWRPSVTRLLLRRAALAFLTLWLLSVVVFAAAQLLPGDVGRAILGPLADARAVAELDHRLGADRPAAARYAEWAGHLLRGDLGTSTTYRAAVAPRVVAALLASLRLAALAFAVVVPTAIAAGIHAALHRDTWRDRAITTLGLSLTVVPEFVSSIVLILVFGLWLRWLPISARIPPDATAWNTLRHLILPALPLVLVLFGYIARIARAGTAEALDADYARTARLKGLPARTVLTRHILRNALPPTITVLAAQAGYLIGGLVVVETLFRYPGLGSLILTAARTHDFAMLEAAILAVGAVTLLASLAADLTLVALDPRERR